MMGADTKIQWAHHTWSPWRGCEHATLPDGSEHPGCAHAEDRGIPLRHRLGVAVWGSEGTRVLAAPQSWDQVRKWNAEAEKAGERRRVFPSVCDPFEDWPGPIAHHRGGFLHRTTDGRCVCPDVDPAKMVTMNELRRDLFDLIDACPWLDFLLLTKRPGNVRRMWSEVVPGGNLDPIASAPYGHPMRVHRSNVWLITSVSDQPTAEALIPPLLECHRLCPVLGVSAEPLLGEIDLEKLQAPSLRPGLCYSALGTNDERYTEPLKFLDLVIIGGESGPHARPCEVDWIRDLRNQCQRTGAACFVKQMGSYVLDSVNIADDWISRRVKLRESKGGDASEWPEDLRVRELPEVVHE